MKEKLRNEIDDKFKWDLSVIYKNEDEFISDYNNLKSLVPSISVYKLSLLKDAKTLFEAVQLLFDISRKIEKLYTYAKLNLDSETSNMKYQKYEGMARSLFDEFVYESSYIEPELLKSEYSVIEKFYLENSKLLNYKNFFERIFRYKEHILSEKEELILSKLDSNLSVSSDIYDRLTDTDLVLGNIKDENEVEVELTDSNYSKYLSSTNRRVRKDAFDTMYNAYGSFINTISSTISGEISSKVNLSQIRNFSSSLEASLFSDNINTSVYNNLIEVVNSKLEVLYKYYDLRKETLKLEEQHLYDIYADLIPSLKKEYSFEKAKEIVLNAVSILGNDYLNDAKKAFDQRWIDIYSSKSKRSGAYSSGCYDTYPYMLLNFQGQLNDVLTLAHELGHSMHSYYSKKNNTYQDSEYTIFVAEVASTVNELIVCNYLLNNTEDKMEKLTILNRQLELYKGTIFRQTMFAEFEKKLHELVEQKEVLTSELISDIYYNLCKKYFGKDVVIDDKIRYEWARIPHFYSNFYVYKYATGLSAASYIVNNIIDKNNSSIQSYLEFLKTGGRYYPLEELKIAGVDMNNKEVISTAISNFDKIINDFLEISNS